MSTARRFASILLIGALVLGSVAAIRASDGIVLAPAEANTTAVSEGQFVDVSGQVDTASSFIRRAELIGYDADGNEFVRQTVFGLNESSGEFGYLDVDADGNVTGRIRLNCQFGDATSMPNDRVHDACEVGDPDAQGITEDQTTTAWDVQLVLETSSGEFASSPLRVDPIPPVIEGYEVIDPTTVRVTFSEPVRHPTGTESLSDWLFREPDGTPSTTRAVVGVSVGTDDCAYAPGEDARSGTDGCTRLLTVAPALPRDATPRIDYFPRGRGAHLDNAANTVFVRSIEPSRGQDADSLAADRVGPVPPVIEQVDGKPATDPDTGERVVLGNDPAPTVVVGEVEDGMPVEVYVDGVAAGSSTAAGDTANVTLDDPLPDGVYDLTATSADTALCDPEDPGAGTCSNESEPSPAVTYDLDTVAPQLTSNPLTRPSTISMEFDEPLVGEDQPSDWTVNNGVGGPVTITAVDDERDDSALGEAEPSPRRTLSYTGGPIVPGATLTYAPSGSRYADDHTNEVADFTAGLEPALLPVVSVRTQPGAEVDRAGIGAPADPVSFTVELSDPVAIGETVTVDYRTVPGTATEGDDYAAVAGTITFSAGERTSDPIDVSVAGDRIDEPSEFVGLELSEPTGARFPDDASTLTAFENIADDDPEPTVGFTVERYDVPEGDSATVTVELTDAAGDQIASGKEVRVAWSTRFDLSADTSDAPEQSGEVTFAPGATTASFAVETLPDDVDEPDELFEVVLADPLNATISSTAGTAEIDILDDDVFAPVISIEGRSADEDDAGPIALLDPGTVELEVHLSQATSRSVRVDWATGTAGTATVEDDFRSASGQLEFEPGDTVLLVEVPLVDDQLDEFDETVEVVLTNPDGATLTGDVASLSGFGTIVDDDPLALAAFTDDSSALGVNEGETVDLTVELDTPSGKDVRLDWTTTYGGSATDADAPAQSGTVVVPAGATTATFEVATSNDDEVEGDETFDVELTGATNGALADDGRPLVATITILDDEVTLPTLTVTGGTADEGALAIPPLVVSRLTWELTLSEATDTDVTVDVRTLATGSATPGADFTGSTDTVTIPAGETSAEFAVDVIDDDLDEFDETVPLVVEGVAGARLPAGAAQVVVDGTITDDDPLVTVSLGQDVDVAEGDVATVDVFLDAPSGKDVSVRYETSAGTATAGDDFDAVTGQVTIPAGDEATSFTVPTNDDGDDEGDETFDVTIEVVEAETAELGDATATVTILDDDLVLGDTPVVTLSGASVEEGDPVGLTLLPTTTMTFRVGLNQAADTDVTVEYTTVAGSATAGDDFATETGEVTIAAGSTTANVDIGIFPDTIDEFDEVFALSLTGVTGDAALPEGGLARSGVIVDDDPLATVAFADDTAAVEVTEGDTATFTVELEGATEKDVTVQWATSFDREATDADAPAQSGTVRIPAGDDTATFTVTTTDDQVEEQDEALSIVLSSPRSATLDGDRTTVASLTILDDEVRLPTLTVTGGEVGEGDGLGPLLAPQLVWTLTLDEPTSVDVTAEVRTTNGGSATSGDDFAGVSRTVTIEAGETSVEVPVDVVDDTLDEFIEEVPLVVENVANAQLPGQVDRVVELGRITDDDPVVVVDVGDDVEVEEGELATIDVTLDAPSGKTVRVDYTTTDAGATAGDDYDTTSGQLTFAPGETTATITVATVDDLTDEAPEDLLVELSIATPDAADLGDGVARVTIIDNDELLEGPPVVGLSAAAVDEGDPIGPTLLATTAMTFEVRLSELADGDVTVDYRTLPGSATADTDYVSATGQVTIADGTDSAELTIDVFPDAVDEFDEKLVVELTGVAGEAQLPPGGVTRTGRILDDDPLATVAYADASLDVGVDEGRSVELTVELTGQTEKDVVVEYAVSYDGGAGPDDAPAQSGTVTVPAGRSSAAFTITTSQDEIDEPAERFSVVLSDPTNATLDSAADVATITINDDDLVVPVLSISGGTVDEGAADVVPPFAPLMITSFAAAPLEESLVFTATLSEPAERDVTLDYTTVDVGTATAGSDYVAQSGTITIPAGGTTAEVAIDVLDDTLDEFDELVFVRFSNVDGARFDDGSSRTDVSGRITDDDPLVTVDLGDDVEVEEGEPATFAITLSAVSGKDVQVRVRTSDGSARAGSDYRATDRTLTIPAGDTETSVTIPTLDDSTLEATEDVEVTMSVVADDTAELGRAAAVLRIDDNDLGVNPGDTVVSLTGDAVDEGDPVGPLPLPLGGGELAFVISLSEPADGAVTVDYVTRAGTATPDEDFAPVSGSVTIADGEDSATVPVEVIADFTDEFDEDLQLVLTDVTGDAVLPGGELARTGRILDDDARAQLRVSDATVLEGSVAELDVTLDNASGKPITVAWELVDGTATAGADYTDASGTLAFPAGTTSRTVQVATLADDDTGELIEQFDLVLSSATNAGIDDARGTVSIVDVGLDGLPTVTAVFLEDVRTVEADADRTALVPVRLSAASDQDVTVTWTSQQLTAVDGEDYRADGGEIVVPAGATSAQIPVTIIGDDEVEPDEDFLVLLTEADGAVITGPTGRVTIEDDDAADDGSTGGEDDLDGAPDAAADDDERGELAATGGGAGFVVFGLALLAARRRREDD